MEGANRRTSSFHEALPSLLEPLDSLGGFSSSARVLRSTQPSNAAQPEFRYRCLLTFNHFAKVGLITARV